MMLSTFKTNNEAHYKKMHSEIIMFYQIIDRDIKSIYRYMLSEETKSNWSKIKKWPFGKIINELQILDQSNNDQLISMEDYRYLKTVVSKRNHWAHSNFLEFIYKDNPFYSEEFNKSYQKLIIDHREAEKIFNDLEKTRLNFINNIS